MAKYCAKCGELVDENEKFTMIITKKAGRILEFECFHFECWKEFFEKSVMMGVEKISKL